MSDWPVAVNQKLISILNLRQSGVLFWSSNYVELKKNKKCELIIPIDSTFLVPYYRLNMSHCFRKPLKYCWMMDFLKSQHRNENTQFISAVSILRHLLITDFEQHAISIVYKLCDDLPENGFFFMNLVFTLYSLYQCNLPDYHNIALLVYSLQNSR